MSDEKELIFEKEKEPIVESIDKPIVESVDETVVKPKKTKKPRKKREYTDEQRTAMLERLKKGRAISIANRRKKRETKDKVKQKLNQNTNKILSGEYDDMNTKLLNKIDKLEQMMIKMNNPKEIKTQQIVPPKPQPKPQPRPQPRPQPKPQPKAQPIIIKKPSINISTFRTKRFWE